MFERSGRTLAPMVRCMLADSGLARLLWGEFIFTVVFLGNREPLFTIRIQSPYTILHGTEPRLRLHRVLGARACVHIENYS